MNYLERGSHLKISLTTWLRTDTNKVKWERTGENPTLLVVDLLAVLRTVTKELCKCQHARISRKSADELVHFGVSTFTHCYS
jgi:hypothetical protein